MAGEGQFLDRREDAHARMVLRLVEDEGRFGKVHLPRDRLHAARRQFARASDDGERVAGERGFREHIDDFEVHACHATDRDRRRQPDILPVIVRPSEAPESRDPK